MNVRGVVSVGVFMVLLAVTVMGATCPYTGDTTPTEYSSVSILPVEKYVGRAFTISINDVYKDGNRVEPAKSRSIYIYFIVDSEVASEYVLRTNDQGKATFTPDDSGKYAVATSSRYIFFDVLAKCGDGLCTSGEDRISCPEDCAKCGDGVCDVGETKQNCPKDCVICGDGVCDVGENRETCPEDCATCGDGVCDINEDKRICPEDCVICGDGICDPEEILGLHETSCPQDCAVCGDDYCDEGEEDPSSTIYCPEDCAVCGDGICAGSETAESCPEDCVISIDDIDEVPVIEENQSGVFTICGDEVCDEGETKGNCPDDCVICGDGVCDPEEILGLHETSCPQDCAVCGDGYCEQGEIETCPEDCASGQGLFVGYFVIPLVIAIIIIIFELTHRFAGAKQHLPEPAGKRTVKLPRMERMETEKLAPFFVIFAVMIAASTLILAAMGLSYSNNLAIFDLAAYLMDNAVLVSLLIVLTAMALGVIARVTYYMEKKQAITMTSVSMAAGLFPGLLIFLNLEYLALMFGCIIGGVFAMSRIKSEESELAVKKPFRMGSEFADKTLFIAAIVLSVVVLMSLYTSEATEDKFSSAIWSSEYTRSYVNDNYGMQQSEQGVRENVVSPFFSSNIGGMSGKLIFSIAVALVLLAVLKVFITIIKMLAGFFAWMFDKSGFAQPEPAK
jgi:hypothetical protein